MAEAVLFSTAEKLLKTLGQLIIQEVISDLGARADLEKLVDKVRLIRGVVLDAEHREQSDPTIKLWFEALRYVVYDADDLAEELSAVVRRQDMISESKTWRKVRNFFSRTNPLLLNYELAGKLKVIRERLDAMAPSMTSLMHLGLKVRLVDEQLAAQKGKERKTDSYVYKGDIIGREEDERKLVNRLVFNSEDLESASRRGSSKNELPRVISVVSIGGLGKTALAQLVCQNDQIQQHFNLTAWVCISDNFDVGFIVRDIVKKIIHGPEMMMRTLMAESEDKKEDTYTTISGAGGKRGSKDDQVNAAAGHGELLRPQDLRRRDNLDSFGLGQLGPFLRHYLGKIKYLIVLDDVWNESLEKWLDLRKYLQGTARGGCSKILITTRLETAARVMGSRDDDIYHLQPLTPEASWTLFTKIAFGDAVMEEDDNIPPTLLDWGRQIVSKCSNHPLLVRTVASLLGSRDRSEAEWKSIKEAELPKLINSDSTNSYLGGLRLSYNHLASELKDCFAFCALFPQDYEMPLEWLTQLWVAHGFIRPPTTSTTTSHKRLEDIAHGYLMELLNRDFFLEEKKDPYGNVHSVKVHDLMHDLARAVAGQNMVRVDAANGDGDDDGKNITNNSSYEEIDARVLHVCIRGIKSSWKAPPSLLKAKRLRTLCLALKTDSSHQGTPALDEISLDEIFRSFKYLRVLDLHGVVKSASLPTSIGKLKLLCFLDLSLNDSLVYLPDSITRLVYLQTLDLHGCKRLEKLPQHFEKLVALMFLDISNCDRLLKNFRHKKKSSMAVPRRLAHHLRITEACFALQQSWWKRGSHVLTLGGHHSNNNTPAVAGRGTFIEKQVRIRLDRELFDDVHEDISALDITGYEEERFPCWQINDYLSSFSSLTRVSITCCKYFRHLPPFSQLPSLNVLVLRSMAALTYVETGCRQFYSSSSSSFFPRLVELELSDLPVLEGWSIETVLLEIDQNTKDLLPSFPALSTLTILNCPNFKSFPRAAKVKHPTLKGAPVVLEQMFSE